MTVTDERVTQSQTRGHRWFAAIYDTMNRAEERGSMGRRRRDLLQDVRGEVLEIGAGTGANFEHYAESAHVIALEPDQFMLKRAREKLAKINRPGIELRQAPAEQLPVPDASIDVLVSTLVLCTAPDVPRALAEARRVLRPDGELRFIEHVRANGLRGRVQDTIKPVWKWLGAGCNPNRRTEQAIRAAGFDIVSSKREMLMPWMVPVITGVARLGATRT